MNNAERRDRRFGEVIGNPRGRGRLQQTQPPATTSASTAKPNSSQLSRERGGSLAAELPDILRELNSTRKSLAESLGISDSYLSRVVRGEIGEKATGAIAVAIAARVGRPEDYFSEARAVRIIEEVLHNPTFLDAAYDLLTVDSKKSR